MQIDLVFFHGCPHVTAARERLAAALASSGAPTMWNEWDSESPATPDHLRSYSSPTVLVNGVDVERKAPTIGAGCAVVGGPSLEAMREALAAASR